MPQSQFDPGHAAFGGGPSESIMHPAVLAALVVVVVWIYLVARKSVVAPLLLGILLIPFGQNIYIGGIHLFVYRILIVVGWVRLLSLKPSPRKFLAGGLGALDKVFLIWAGYRALSVVLTFLQAGAVVNQVAFLIDALGGYFLFRSLIRDDKDVQRVAQVLAVVGVIAALGMIVEQVTHQNIFALLGGMQPLPSIRNGRLRAQGMFQISIIAGSFAATTFPLFLWLWKSGETKLLGLIGAAAAIVMAGTSASSTPIGALLGAILVVCLWPIRKNMRIVRWGIVVALVGLQLTMKAPVWYVISHFDFVSGSSSWNRAYLIDTFFRHIGDWWLIGTHDNVNWGWDMWDQCNQFVMEGETGGLITLACFIAMFTICFKKIGAARKAVQGDHKKEWFFWFLGAALFAQVLAYLGIDYFDQSKFVWYALLAIIPAATMSAGTSAARGSQPELVPAPASPAVGSNFANATTKDAQPARSTLSSAFLH